MESSSNWPEAAAWIKGKEKMIMVFEDCVYVRKISPNFLKLFASTDSLYLSSLDFCDNSLHSPFFAWSHQEVIQNISIYLSCFWFLTRMINISESSDFSLLLSPSCIFNPYFFPWHKRGKLPKGWILTALALFCLYWWELSVQMRKLSCFVNDNEYLGMQMSMWVLCLWNRENRMFCHSELSRNCLPGKRSQHTNKWQFLGEYRGGTGSFCTSQTKLPLLHDTNPLWKAIWFDVPPLQEFREPCTLSPLPSQMNWCIWKVPSSNLFISITQQTRQILEIWWHTFCVIISMEENPTLL